MLGRLILPTYIVVSVLAWLVARKQREHVPLAAYVSFMAAGEVIRDLLSPGFRGRLPPYAGWSWWAFHLDAAVSLGWQFFYVACCLYYFTRWKPSIALGAWFVTVCAFALGIERLSRPTSENIYLAIWVVTLTVSWVCIAWGMFRRRDLTPGLAHLMLILYAAADVGVVLLRMSTGLRNEWDFTRIATLLVLTTGIAAHVRWLVTQPHPMSVA